MLGSRFSHWSQMNGLKICFLKVVRQYMYLVKLSLPVFDGPHPLLDGRLDAVGRELLLRDLVVVAGVDSINKSAQN